MFWPVSCPLCGAVGEILCGPCLRSLMKPQLPRCLWCGEHAPCKIHKSGEKIYPASIYEGGMKEIILAFKYGGYEAIGPKLGKAMSEVLPYPDIDVLIPVPLHLKSERRYNQAESIAAGLGKAWNIKVLCAARWTLDVAPRAGLGMNDRLSLRSGVFAFGKNITGLRVGFVDDVCTTGSTLSALAKAAASRGAVPVRAFAAAHVPPRP